MIDQRKTRRMLLVAAVGVATMTVSGCDRNIITSGNLMAPPDTGAQDAGDDAGSPDAATAQDTGVDGN